MLYQVTKLHLRPGRAYVPWMNIGPKSLKLNFPSRTCVDSKPWKRFRRLGIHIHAKEGQRNYNAGKQSPQASRSTDPKKVAASLALAGLGGGAAFTVGAPLPWMLGPLFTCTLASLAGASLKMPATLRLGMQTVVGVLLGSTFTPDFFSNLVRFAPTVAGLLCFTLAASSLGQRVLTATSSSSSSSASHHPQQGEVEGEGTVRRGDKKKEEEEEKDEVGHMGGGMDAATAFFAAAPGGLNDMVIIGGELGADERVVAVCHSIRLLLVVSILPFLFRSLANIPAQAAAEAVSSRALLPPMPLFDAICLVMCALVGPVLGKHLRLPARFLVGPMLVSAAAHLFGITSARPPPVAVFAAQTVIGGSVGCRFAGVKLRDVIQVTKAAIGSTLATLSLAGIFSALISSLTGTSWPLILLAYSPGGITEMTLLALALGYDAAFVATHHVLRISCLVLVIPILYRFSMGTSAKIKE